MMTSVDTDEDEMTEIEKNINMLIKAVEERDYEIASLKNHIKICDAIESSHKHTVKNDNMLTKGRQLCKKVHYKI